MRCQEEGGGSDGLERRVSSVRWGMGRFWTETFPGPSKTTASMDMV